MAGFFQCQVASAAGKPSPAGLGVWSGASGPARSKPLMDVRDFYRAEDGRAIRLERAPQEAAIVVPGAADPDQASQAVSAVLPWSAVTSGRFARLPSGEQVVLLKSGDERATPDLVGLRRLPGVVSAQPVYVDPGSGLRMIPAGDLIVRLKVGVTPAALAAEFAGRRLGILEAIGSKRLQCFRVRLLDPQESVLAAAENLHGHPQLEWATPDFVREIERQFTPNDPLFSAQQHLHNVGQENGVADGDVDAVEAWDMTRGTNAVVIAVIDDGVDITHPDLNIFRNPGESGGGRETNGIDDDGNGRIDDVTGWNFVNNNNTVRPMFGSAHGTACAGVAAARLNNSLRTAGIAGECVVLPVKMFDDYGVAASDSAIGAAISYAADFADVLSNSWGGGSESAFINAAIADAVTNGRQGKGCPVFFAAGNRGSNWYVTGLDLPVGVNVGPGTFSLGFRFVKDDSVVIGEDLVRIDNLRLVGADGYTTVSSSLGSGGRQDFEGSFPPAGWSTYASAGAIGWSVVSNGSYRATGGVRSAQSGATGNSQWSELRSPALSLTGVERLRLQSYFSAEGGYDGLLVRIYDSFGAVRYEYPLFSLDPIATIGISYPARHPDVIAVGASTDAERRADWSQFGPELDVVAPSNGGWNGVTTLDAVGTTGYSTNDYTHQFGGTSSATPLAAGIGALMLSVAPQLTVQQVHATLRATADLIGPNPTPGMVSAEYGYGRVNARRAVEAVAENVVTVAVLDGSAVEGGDSASFAVTRTGNTNVPMSVSIATYGTATPGLDYVALGGSVVIPAGVRSVPVEIVPVDDPLVEVAETVGLTLLSGQGYSLGLSISNSVTIGDNDTQVVTVVAAEGTATEGGAAGQFVVSRTGLTNAPLVVTLGVSGSATPVTDYSVIGTHLTLPAGVASVLVLVQPVDDQVPEWPESVVVTVLPGTGYVTGVPVSAVVIVADNEPPVVEVVTLDNTAAESGPNTGVFQLVRTGATTALLRVHVALSGTALSGLDYVISTNVIEMPAGTNSVLVPVIPLNDPSEEPPETIVATLGTGDGYTLGAGSRGEIALMDDDAVTSSEPGVIQFDGTSGYLTAAKSLVPESLPLENHTVELWCLPTAVSGSRFLTADDAFDLLMVDGVVTHVVYDAAAVSVAVNHPRALRVAEWNHVAIQFDSDARSMRVAVNGELGASTTVGPAALYIDPLQSFTLGARRLTPKTPAEGFFQGFLDEVRVSGVMRYQASFIPPTRFERDGATRGLYHFDAGSGADPLLDDSGLNNRLTVRGGAGSVAQHGPAGATPGPSGYWRLDENIGSAAADASGNANTGVLQGGATWDAAGWFGGSLTFDGLDGMLSVPHAPELEVGRGGRDFTVAAWVNLVDGPTGAWRALMQKGGGTNRTFSLFLHPDSNRIHYRVSTTANWNEGGDSTGGLPVGAWTHLALVKSGNKLRLFFNGALDSEQTLTAPVISNPLPLYVGKHPSLPGTRCRIDDLRVHTRALGSLELFELSSLVGRWKFAEGAGSVARDSTPNRNDASLAAGAQAPGWVPYGADSALAFDGIDDLLTAPNSASLEVGRDNADFSAAFWMNPQDHGTGAWRALMQKGAGTNRTFSVFLHPSTNRLHYRVSTFSNWNEGGDSVRALQTNTWTHVALVKTGSKLRLYLGGVLDSERTLPSGVVANSLPLYFGKHPSLAGVKGLLDDVRVYQRALTPGLIAELAAASVPSLGGETLAGAPSKGDPAGTELARVVKSERALAGNNETRREILPVEAFVDGGEFVVRVDVPVDSEAGDWRAEVSEDLVAWRGLDPSAAQEVGLPDGRRVAEWRLPAGAGSLFLRIRED